MLSWLSRSTGVAFAALLLGVWPAAPAAAVIRFDSARVLASAGDVLSFEIVDVLPIQASPSVVSEDGLSAASLTAATVGGPDGIALRARASVSVQPGGPTAGVEYTVYFCVEEGTEAPAFSQTARLAIDPADVDLTGDSTIHGTYFGFDAPGLPGSGRIDVIDGAGQPEATLDTDGQLNLGFGDYTCELGNRGVVSGNVGVGLVPGALAQAATAEFEIEVIIGSASLPPTGSTEYRWVGGRSGAFADPQSWSPPGVPAFVEDERSDTALVEGGRNVTIDLAAGGLSRVAGLPGALDPRAVVRRVGRLVVEDSRSLRLVDGTLQADALSPLVGERSLELRGGGSLLLDGGGLKARHVSVGAVGDGALDVAGDLGFLETTGRLGLGFAGSGALGVSGGATVVSAEGVIGEDEGPGTARVEGQSSLWTTGNLAVGLESDGLLLIEDGAKVDSDAGAIDFNLDEDARGRVEVRGMTPGGSPSEWKLDALDVGPRGSLSVESGGRVEVAGPLRIGREGADPDCFTGRACVDILDGQVQATGGVVVGDGGGGELLIGPDGVLAAGGELAIAPDHATALVRIDGPSRDESVFTDLAVGTGEEAYGVLYLSSGAALDLLGRFRLGGPDGSRGSLSLIGDPDDPEATRVQVFEGDAFDSLVGDGSAAPPGEFVPFTGSIDLERARLELSGPSHGLVIQRDGLLRADDGVIAIESPAGLVNRGRILGDLIVEGSYVQEATGVLRGFVLSTPGPQARARGAARAAAAPAPAAFGPLVVTGDASLAGRVELQFGGGIAPRAGERFEVLDVAGDVTGQFDEVSIQGLVPGSFAFEPSLAGGKLALTSTQDAAALPAVSVKAKAKLKETAKKGGKIKLKRTGDTSAPLVVAYSVGGTARSGVDFEALPGTIEIPAKKKSATIIVRPLADGLAEGPETIELELAPDETFAPGVVSRATIELLSRDR